MNCLTLIFISLLGLTFGSFLSSFTYRFPKNISFVEGRSFCPKCRKKISWYDNIPLISYLFLKGKCRSCKGKISLRYPVIEIVTLFSFLITFLTIGKINLNFFVYLVIYLIIASIFIMDLEKGIIPDELIWIGLAISFLIPLLRDQRIVFNNLFAGFSISSFFLFIHLITKGKGMGLGDVKFVLFPGTFLLFPLNLIWLLTSFLTGAFVGVILILTKKAKFGKPIPFGPFLALNFFVVLIWGEKIIQWLTRLY